MGYIEAVFTMSVKMSTIPVKCQLVQENDCQPHQEKTRLALQRYSVTVPKTIVLKSKVIDIFIYIIIYINI